MKSALGLVLLGQDGLKLLRKECAEERLDDAFVFQSAAYFDTPKIQLSI